MYITSATVLHDSVLQSACSVEGVTLFMTCLVLFYLPRWAPNTPGSCLPGHPEDSDILPAMETLSSHHFQGSTEDEIIKRYVKFHFRIAFLITKKDNNGTPQENPT